MTMVNWRGNALRRDTSRHVRAGMNKNLSRCVRVVKPRTPVVTGVLQGSMRMEPARDIGSGTFVGFFGSWDVDYAVHVELGTMKQTPRLMMTQTADEEFPKLPDDIRSEIKKG